MVCVMNYYKANGNFLLSLINVNWRGDLTINILEASYWDSEDGTLFPQRSLLSFTWERRVHRYTRCAPPHAKTHITKGITLKVLGFTLIRIGMKRKEGWPS